MASGLCDMEQKRLMDEIIAYLQTKYAPAAILVYGSFADGTQNENSDFDALVLSPTHREFHDTSFVGETQLDVFVYPVSLFQGEYHPETFLQVYGGILVMDTEGVGHALLQQVEAYVKALPGKTLEEQEGEIQWCKKMLLRAKRQDTEGAYRWHWLLTESLEIFCDIAGYPYLGPKKSLRYLQKQFPKAFRCYTQALTDFRYDTLKAWIDCMEKTRTQSDSI